MLIHLYRQTNNKMLNYIDLIYKKYIRLESWKHAQDHGIIAGLNMIGEKKIYDNENICAALDNLDDTNKELMCSPTLSLHNLGNYFFKNCPVRCAPPTTTTLAFTNP